jgi:outer membrane protein TolC
MLEALVSKTAIVRTATAFAFLTALGAPSAFAQQAPSDARVKELMQQALQQVTGDPKPAPALPAQQTGPEVKLTVEDAVGRALDRNLNIASERLTPQAQDFTIAATEAFYRPNLTSAVSNNSAVRLAGTVFEGGSRTVTDTQAWSAGITQQMWWGGGNYSVNWTNSRQVSDASNTTFNPLFDSGLQARYTQPLLQNFKIDNNRANLLTNRIQRDISDINLRSTIASIAAQVQNAYWELVFSYQNLEATQRSLELSSKLVQDNRARVEIGTMAPIDVIQAQAEEATRRQAVVNAQNTLRNNELALKRLIVGGTDDELWLATINPTDRPTPVAEAIDLEGAIRNALQNRTDLATTRKNLESTDVQLRSLVNQTMPQLNLIGTYNLSGRGGTSIDRGPGNIIVDTFPGGYFDALGALRNWDAPTWNLQLNFAWPIGTSAPEANLARQRLLRRQTEATVKTTELQIATEITSAALNIRNSLEAMQAATVARELAVKRLEAEQSKMEVGMSTNFQVVQAQRDLFDARNRELREQLNYQRALVDYQRAQISPR